MLSRRSLFGGLAALIAAPAIVRVANIMPVSTAIEKRITPWWGYERYGDVGTGYDALLISSEDVLAASEYEWVELAQVVTATLRAHQSQVADAVSQHNALFSRFKSMALPA